MDSPPPKRIGVAAVFSSPTPSKSPEMQESPFSHYVSNLYPINSPNSMQISCPEKEVQSFHSSRCVGESLANPVEVDDINSVDPWLQSTKEVYQLLPSGYTGSKDTIKKVDNAIDSTREAGGLTSLYQAENNLPFLSSLKMVETAFNLSNGEMFDKFSTSENNNDFAVSDMNLDPVSGVQYCGGYVAQNVGARLDYRNGICRSFPEPLQIDGAFKNSDEILILSKEYYKEKTKTCNSHLTSLKPGQAGQLLKLSSIKVPNHLQHRHLHFEPDIAYKSVATGNTANSWDSLINSKNVVVPHGERRTISNAWESVKLVNYAQSITSQSSFCPFEVVRSTQTSGNSAILCPLTSGIGLHENSIGRSMVLDSDMFASKNSTGYLSSQDKLVPEGPNNISISTVAMTMFSHADVDQRESQAGIGLHVNSIGRSVVLDLDMFANVDQQESQAGVVATSAINSLNHPFDSFSLTKIEQQVASGEGRMSTSQNADSVEELNQVCPARKRDASRKRAANKRENDGCKQCNCKRSKCLKLYCECFTAGVYCVDSCACENCFNKPEYDDLVLDTRQQIESRNPLAFTSKIITHATDSPENVMEEGDWKTPSSARHKRGCNCKKSKCHQRYCECYQAKVGCSDACRCEGCQNSFGKKTAYKRAERCDKPSYEKLDDAQGGTDWSMDQYSPTWEGLAELNSLSNSSFHDRMDVDDIPTILKDTPYSTLMALKARSPNQKQVFPPRLQSERQRSSSPPGMSCGRKLSLQAVSSFPSLIPYSNSEESDSLFRNDQTDSTGNH